MAQPVSSSKQLPTGASPPNWWCHTVCELVKTEFVWKIQQFELLQGPGSRLESAKFSATDNEGVVLMTWSLILDDAGISLCEHIVNAKGVKELSQEVYVYQNTAMPKLVNAICRDILVLKNLIVDGNVTISCQIETYTDKENLTGQNAVGASQLFGSKEELLGDFGKLFENMIHFDVIFNVGDQQFTAHKDILVARSPIFAAMFKHSTKENLTGEVEVLDIEPDVFKELLRYIYTGEVPL